MGVHFERFLRTIHSSGPKAGGDGRSVGKPGFRQNLMDVILHSGKRNTKVIRNFLVALSAAYEFNNLAFSFADAFKARIRFGMEHDERLPKGGARLKVDGNSRPIGRGIAESDNLIERQCIARFRLGLLKYRPNRGKRLLIEA
jgi:hypothetical protein